MIKTALKICILLVVISCKKQENQMQRFAQTNLNLEFSLVDSLAIKTPDTVSTNYGDSYIFKDSLFYGIGSNNKIELFDLKNETHLKTIALDNNLLKGNIQNIIVRSRDSIIVFNSDPPKMFIVNEASEIIDEHNFGYLDLNIDRSDLPKNEPLYTLPFHYGYIKPSIVSNRLYLMIAPIGANEVPGFNNTQRIGIYDMDKRSWVKAIAPPKGLLKKLNGTLFFNYDLMMTYFTIANQKIYVNYPINHYSYIYNLDGKFLDSLNTSSTIITKMPKGMTQKELNNRQKSWNFRITTPFYGPLMYHDKANVFSRIAYEAQNLYGKDAKLNSGANRKSEITFYDTTFKQRKSISFTNSELGVGKNYPLSQSMLVGKQPEHWHQENEFIHKYLYKITNYEN